MTEYFNNLMIYISIKIIASHVLHRDGRERAIKGEPQREREK